MKACNKPNDIIYPWYVFPGNTLPFWPMAFYSHESM